MNLRTNLIAGLAVITWSTAAWTQAPCAIPFQSYLVDEDGSPSDTPIDVEITFYDGADPGAAPIDCRVFTSAAVNNGWLNLSIDACSLPEPGPSGCGVMTVTDILEAGAAEGSQVYMALRLGDDVDDAGPRTPLGAVPYAVHATNAETAVTATSAGTADVAAELEGFDPAAVDAVSLGGIASDNFATDADLSAHVANPNAHHNALSDGLDITPASVVVGDGFTSLTDGVLDLGADADDELSAAIVTTLTGGGSADALHSHAGAGGAECRIAAHLFSELFDPEASAGVSIVEFDLPAGGFSGQFTPTSITVMGSHDLNACRSGPASAHFSLELEYPDGAIATFPSFAVIDDEGYPASQERVFDFPAVAPPSAGLSTVRVGVLSDVCEGLGYLVEVTVFLQGIYCDDILDL